MKSSGRWAAAAILLVLGGVALFFLVTRGGGTASDRAARSLANRPSARSSFTEPTSAPRLIATGSIAGRVLDERGQPVAGARICARGSADDLSDEQLGLPFCTETDGAGAYQVTALLPAAYDLDASARGYKPGRHDVDRRGAIAVAAGQKREGVDITLRSGGVELVGRVRDIGGGVVPGATVHVYPAGLGAWSKQAAAARTTADGEGEFRVFVAPGLVDVSAQAPAYGRGSVSASAPGNSVEVLLTPEAVLSGRVVRIDGETVAGALVRSGPIDGSSWNGQRSALSGDDGRFTLTRLGPGRYKPTASHDEGVGTAAASVRLGLAERVGDVEIVMHAAVTVTGKVLIAPGDTPCEQGSVTLIDRPLDRRGSGSIGPGGAVAIRAVLPGSYDVHVACHRRPRSEARLVVGAKGTGPQRWLVGGGQKVTGTVYDSAGAPLAGVAVRLGASGGDPRGSRESSMGETGADGSFSIEGVAPGAYSAWAVGPGVPASRYSKSIEVKAGEDLRDLALTLETGGGVQGSVLDERGRPVAGARISTHGDHGHHGAGDAHANAEGRFQLSGLLPGAWRLSVSREGRALRRAGSRDDDVQGERITVAENEITQVTLRVEGEDGVIRGRVTEAGRPVADALVDARRESESASADPAGSRRALRGGWGRRPAVTDGEGNFELRSLSVGKYTVRAFRRGGGEALVEHVALGASVTLDIRPTSGATGTVGAEAGPPESFTLTITNAAEGFRREETFWRTDGRWELNELPPGNLRLTVASKEGTAETTVVLKEGERKEGIALRLAPRARLRGRVISFETGEPLAGMIVGAAPAGQGIRVETDSSAERRQITDAEGRFELENAPSGRVWVATIPRDRNRATHGFGKVRAELRAGETIELPPIRCPSLRLKRPARAGDLGFTLKQTPPDPEDRPEVRTVAVVRPDGPAAAAGMQAGDVIVSVDGIDVTGANDYLYFTLSEVGSRQRIRLGLASGRELVIVAGAPL